jgi:hypothetical protein
MEEKPKWKNIILSEHSRSSSFTLSVEVVTGNWNPFAMAKGTGNDNFSASLLQMLILQC